MPTHCEEDVKTGLGYCQWGYSKGKKYVYKVGSKRSKTVAKNKADKQGRAIKANSFKGGKANTKTKRRNTKRRNTRRNTTRITKTKRRNTRRNTRRKVK